MISFIKSLTNLISIITVVQLILFGLFLLTAPKKRSADRIALALFLFANSIYILDFLTYRYSSIIISYSVNFFYIGDTFGFLFGPLLYLYTKSVNSKDFHFTKNDILHFVPFFLVFVLTLVCLIPFPDTKAVLEQKRP